MSRSSLVEYKDKDTIQMLSPTELDILTAQTFRRQWREFNYTTVIEREWRDRRERIILNDRAVAVFVKKYPRSSLANEVTIYKRLLWSKDIIN